MIGWVLAWLQYHDNSGQSISSGDGISLLACVKKQHESAKGDKTKLYNLLDADADQGRQLFWEIHFEW